MAESTILGIGDKRRAEVRISRRHFTCWKCRADNSDYPNVVCPACGWSHCSYCGACAPNCFGLFCETRAEYNRAAQEYILASLEPDFSKTKWFAEKVELRNEYERKRRFAIYEREKKAREAERVAKIEREEHIRQMHEFVPVGTVVFFPARVDDEGTVVGYSFSEDGKSEYIHVAVNGVEKRFIFPDAFDMNYLSLL